ncbi:MAG: Rnf-Nqr domain containing protein, partial [Bacillota bacterium]
EAFASKNPTHRAIADAIGMGLGFTWVLVLLSAIREFFGMGSIFGVELLGSWYEPMVIMVLPAGAFITLGILVGLMNVIKRRGN